MPARPYALTRIAPVVTLAFSLAACAPAATAPSASPAASVSAPGSRSPLPSASASASAEPAIAYPDNVGEGVTIAILDRGIDWRNADLRNSDGTTRIRWILDMSGQNWCSSDNPTPVEYSADDINAALISGGELNHRDAVGHGTATAGLAAGNGSALADGHLRGVAPGADLIVLKVTSEGAPQHGSVGAEQPFNGCIDDALDWLDARLDELNQPAVALWNAGTQWGPIDGSSATSRRIAESFGPDRPGRIWVSSSGDEGSLPSHAGGTYAPGSPLEIEFEKTADLAYPTAWYSGEAPVNVTLSFDDTLVVGPVGPAATAQGDGVSITQYAPGNEFYPWQSTSGDRAIHMVINGHSGSGVMRFEAVAGEGRVDVYGDVLGSEFLTSSIEFAADDLQPGRLNDTISTNGVVGTSVYQARDHYTDINGRSHDTSAEGVTGDIWLKSSDGPTRDGRMVIDIAAAGQNAFASLGADSYWSTLTDVLPADGDGHYVVFGGGSAAAPIVTGTVALMLERNPTLTAAEVKDILHATAKTDEFTGDVPNTRWGYGKLDIVAAVAAAGR